MQFGWCLGESGGGGEYRVYIRGISRDYNRHHLSHRQALNPKPLNRLNHLNHLNRLNRLNCLNRLNPKPSPLSTTQRLHYPLIKENFLKSYKGPYYNLRYIPKLRDIGVSGQTKGPVSPKTPSRTTGKLPLLAARMHLAVRSKWEFPKTGGTSFWGPENKDPTI